MPGVVVYSVLRKGGCTRYETESMLDIPLVCGKIIEYMFV